MKKKLLIRGGGSTGFRTALSAIKQARHLNKCNQIEIILVNPTIWMNFCFGEIDAQPCKSPINIEDYLTKIGVRFMQGKVEVIRPDNNSVMLKTDLGLRKIYFDYLILAAGSIAKPIQCAGIATGFRADKKTELDRLYTHAKQISNRVLSNNSAGTIILAGGISHAIQQQRELINCLLKKTNTVFNYILLLKEYSHVIANSEQEIKHIILGEITSIEGNKVNLSSGDQLLSETVIWTPEYRPNPLNRFFYAQRDEHGRLNVNSNYKLAKHNNIIITGSAAKIDPLPAGYAIHKNNNTGTIAGENAVSDIFGYKMNVCDELFLASHSPFGLSDFSTKSINSVKNLLL